MVSWYLSVTMMANIVSSLRCAQASPRMAAAVALSHVPITEKTHEALLLVRRLLAVAAHRGAGSRHRAATGKGRRQGQAHRRRRGLLADQPERVRAGACAGQRRAADRGPGD